MSIVDTIYSEMKKKGVNEANVGGVRFIRYNPSPLEQLNNIGKAIETKKRLEKERREEMEKKANPEDRKKALEKWAEIEKMYQNPMEEYLTLSKGN